MRAAARARWRARRIAAANRAAASTCFYCAVRFTPAGPDHRTVDHRVPRSRGGSDGLGNLVFACFACNQRKRDRAEEDFLASTWLANRREDVAEARLGDGPDGYGETMADETTADDPRVRDRAELLPEEQAVGSDDPDAQAEAILDESDERRASRRAAPSSTVEHRTSDEVTPPTD